MSTLVIASSAADYNNLVRKGFLKDIKDAFDATKLTWCNSAECLKSLSQEVDYILYFNSFKNLPYSKVRSLAAASSTVDNVYGVEIKNNKIWLYEDGVIADCIKHTANIGTAIKAAINRAKRVIKTGELVLTALVAVLFTAFMISFILRADTNMSITKDLYAQTQDRQVKEEDNAGLSLFFVE